MISLLNCCSLNPPVIPRNISRAHGIVQQGLPGPVATARRRPAVQQRPQRVSVAGRARHVARQGTVLRGVPGFRAGENRMDTIPFSTPFPMLDRNVGGCKYVQVKKV